MGHVQQSQNEPYIFGSLPGLDWGEALRSEANALVQPAITCVLVSILVNSNHPTV